MYNDPQFLEGRQPKNFFCGFSINNGRAGKYNITCTDRVISKGRLKGVENIRCVRSTENCSKLYSQRENCSGKRCKLCRKLITVAVCTFYGKLIFEQGKKCIYLAPGIGNIINQCIGQIFV